MPYRVGTDYNSARHRGEMMLTVDDDGDYAPVTLTDKGGLPIDTTTDNHLDVDVSKSPLLEEQNRLLRRIVFGLELLLNQELPDPGSS